MFKFIHTSFIIIFGKENGMKGKKILTAFLLNLGFSIIEIFGGIFSGSIAILSDAFHDFGDALSIALSFFLERKSGKKADSKYTFGYARFSTLGAFITNLSLLIGSIGIIVASVHRLFEPVEVKSDIMIILAVIGIIVNLFATLVVSKGDNLNHKAISFHMLEDVLGWVAVLVGAIIMKITEFAYLDSILSIVFSTFIFIHSLKDIKKITELFLLKVPKSIELKKLEKEIEKIKGVISVHHLHIWSMDETNHCATMHVVCGDNEEEIKKNIKEKIRDFGIIHATMETERETDNCCEKECKGFCVSKHHHHHH